MDFLFVTLLCCSFSAAQVDALDLHARQFAAVTNGAVVAFAPLELERDDLFILALLEHFGGDRRARNQRSAVCQLIAIGEHKYVTERSRLANFGVQKVDVDRVAFCDAKLSTSSSDNCVSHKPFFRGEKAGQNSTSRPVWQTESFVLLDMENADCVAYLTDVAQTEVRRGYAAASVLSPMSSP
jgi:hypothetical protein